MNAGRRLRSAPVRVKIFVPVTAVVVAAFACIAYATSLVLERQLQEASERTALQKADVAEAAVRRAMLDGLTREMKHAVENLGESPELPRIALRKVNGQYVAERRVPGHAYVPTSELPLPGTAITQEILSDGQSYLRVTKSIANDRSCFQCHPPSQKTLGYLEVDVSTTWLTRRVSQSHTLIAAAAGITLVLVWLAVTLSVNAAVLGPLHRLGRAMSGLKRGDRQIRLEADSRDEIGRLVRHFNEMAEQIREAEQDLVRTERQLAEAERLASVGLMAAGIAHEINNPLAAVSMAAELLNTPGISEEQRSKLAKMVLEGTERIQNIVAELLTLDRRQGLVLKPEDPATVLRQALHSVDVPAHIRVHFRVQENLPKILVHRDKIARALGNIIKNAVQAMPEKGELTLSTETSDGRMNIYITDTGCGIAPEILEHIFDPFFSTREVGKGFGLGLAFAHSMIEQHGGEVFAASTVGEGSTFTVVLPLAQEETQDAKEGMEPGEGH